MVQIVGILFNPTSVAITIIVCFFLYLTRKSWNGNIKKLVINIKNKYFSAQTNKDEQKKVQDLGQESAESKKAKKFLIDLEESKERIKKLEENNGELFKNWKYYMFSYFSLYLVISSKLALLWLQNNSNITKDLFKLNMVIPSTVLDKEVEKEAIFNALVSNYLISKDNRDLYYVTNIGLDFLKFIGYVKI